MTRAWERQRKIACLPGKLRSAETTLAQTMEKARAGRIKHIALVIEWDDGTVDTDWSAMKLSTLTFLKEVFGFDVTKAVATGEGLEEIDE